MKEIYEFIALAKFFTWLEIGITIVFLIAGIVFAIRKRMFKFAFRKHDVWQLQETVEEIQKQIYEVNRGVSTDRFDEVVIRINNQINDNKIELKKFINLADQRLNEVHVDLTEIRGRLFNLELQKLPTSKQYHSRKTKKK